jgi:hypothetical protein
VIESALSEPAKLNGLSKEKAESENRQAQAPQTHEGASA